MTANGANNEMNQRLDRLESGQEELRAGQKETNRRLDRLESGQEELRSGQKETNRRLDRLESGQEELRAGHEELRAGHEELRAGHEELRAGHEELRAGHEELRAGHEELRGTVARIERNLQALRDDIGPLKAAHAANGARKAMYRICAALGLTPLGRLREGDLAKAIQAADTSGISVNEIDSFLGADVVIRAAVQDGTIHYVAVEASYTVDERDTRRALRNAEFLTRFTGMSSHAVVAGVRMDEGIRPVIDAGDVHWRRLTDGDFQID